MDKSIGTIMFVLDQLEPTPETRIGLMGSFQVYDCRER